jgi:hypothetical protein
VRGARHDHGQLERRFACASARRFGVFIMSSYCVRIAAASVAVSVFAFGIHTASGQSPPPKFEPWAWDFQSPSAVGHAVWKRHMFWEDNANTAFVLAQELVALPGQTGSHPEVLLFNEAQFIPPAGVALEVGELRKIADGSVRDRGVQVLINARNAKIDVTLNPAFIYPDPTFFIGVKSNEQIDLNYFSLDPTQDGNQVSATRGAFGTLPKASAPTSPTVPAYAIVPPHHQEAIPAYGSNPAPYHLDALYVTAGVGYPLTTFENQTLAAALELDRLVRFEPSTADWIDESSRVPPSVRQGHSSGACWADFDGDGFLDLFVGRTGDDFVGAQNYLLLYNETTGNFDIANQGMLINGSGFADYTRIDATWDVVAGDIDLDGDPDIVVANREPRTATPGAESIDYVLRNNANAKFQLIELSTTPSDTRSVALGNLFGHGTPTIVFANAGSDGYSNDLTIPPNMDDPLEAYRWNLGTSTFDNLSGALFLDANAERDFTKPLTQQVLIADVCRPNANGTTNPPGSQNVVSEDNGPDGKPDVLLVNGRDILQHGAESYAGNVTVLANKYDGASQPVLQYVGTVVVPWARSAALADFCAGHGAPAGSKDMFVGTGNRFHGTDSLLVQHLGQATNTTLPFNTNAGTAFIQEGTYDRMPGNEFGYGFDFADCNGDGWLDAVQGSRAYNFFVPSILGDPVLSPFPDHLDFTSTGTADNRRGRLKPRVMEDTAFADFNGDFWPDLITVGGWYPSDAIAHSGSAPTQFTSAVKVFEKNGSSLSPPFSGGDDGWHPWANPPVAPSDPQVPGFPYPMDSHIDPNGRTAYPIPGILDRVVPGDINNDGKTDAIVLSFELRDPATLVPGQPVPPIPILGSSPGQYLPTGATLDEVLFGFMYLENVYGTAGGTWLKDMFNTKLKSPTGSISGAWNRSLGNIALIDIDNDGTLDLYATNGVPHTLAPGAINDPPTVSSIEQVNDLVFMNQGGLNWGELVERPGASPQIANVHGDTIHPPDSFGLAWGDVNHDGRVDVVTTHAFGPARAFPSLLSNVLDPLSPAFPYFNDVYLSSIPTTPAALDDAVHSKPLPSDPTRLLDEAKYPCIFDFDADGDLDLVLAIGNNVPRFFRNLGNDTNGNGLFESGEGAVGTFEDVTDDVCRWIRPTIDCQDMAAVDIDRDGDLDLAMNPFSDEVVFWRNDMGASDLPTITDAWPRIGGRRGDWIIFEGADLTGVTYVELRFAGGVTQTITGSDVIVIDPRHLRVKIPTNSPPGLAQVRLRKRVGSAYIWSKQYFGYFVLLRKP